MECRDADGSAAALHHLQASNLPAASSTSTVKTTTDSLQSTFIQSQACALQAQLLQSPSKTLQRYDRMPTARTWQHEVTPAVCKRLVIGQPRDLGHVCIAQGPADQLTEALLQLWQVDVLALGGLWRS